MNRQYLQIPGPTNIPERVLRSLSRPLSNHRGPAFKKLLDDITRKLKRLLRTDSDVLFFPSSGSGILEASVVNLFSKGDTIVTVGQGVFSERYGKIARAFGLEVIEIAKEWGEAVSPEDIIQVLEKDTGWQIKAVCLPQNETATGVVNDIEAVTKHIRAMGHPSLIVVDGVSSIACVPFYMDEWGVDVVITASQKGLMLPPGMGIVALNNKAWTKVNVSNLPKWYWDFSAVKNAMDIGQFPYTPATSLFYGLEESLELLEEEGLDQVWARHHRNASLVRTAGQALGLKRLANDEAASDTVTAFWLPEGINYPDLSKYLLDQYSVVIGGGLGKLQGQIFRIGHLGALDVPEVLAIMGCVELALIALGYPVVPGTATGAITQALTQSDRLSD